VNGERIERMVLTGKVRVRVIRAVVVSHFEVGTRGRAILATIDDPQIKTKAAFVALP
jgi:hypothetical protein